MIEKIKFTKKRNILWVDDDIKKPALEPDRDELKERNCKITEMTGPKSFLEKLNDSNERIDGVLIDCFLIDTMLPNGDNLTFKETDNNTKTGLILLKRLIESGKYREVPIIVYSVIDEDEIRDFCLEKRIPLDRVTILNKSMTPKDFANKVVEIVEPEQILGKGEGYEDTHE